MCNGVVEKVGITVEPVSTPVCQVMQLLKSRALPTPRCCMVAEVLYCAQRREMTVAAVWQTSANITILKAFSSRAYISRTISELAEAAAVFCCLAWFSFSLASRLPIMRLTCANLRVFFCVPILPLGQGRPLLLETSHFYMRSDSHVNVGLIYHYSVFLWECKSACRLW
jgi:hypothetical protein